MEYPKELLDFPIATLEEFGLPVRMINAIEEVFGAIYIRDLQGVTRREFLEGSELGKVSLICFEESVKKLLLSYEGSTA